MLCCLTYLVANDLRWEYGSIAFGKQKTQRSGTEHKSWLLVSSMFLAGERLNKNIFDPCQTLEIVTTEGRWPNRYPAVGKIQNLTFRRAISNGISSLKTLH